ncbi:MAG: EamA family transporter [Rhodoplanes sp.]|uniref:EamA family transporter n=1 Tax=Rhodoplanes sp. TaxID=1968906 RepID=UPI00178EA241|nr:EamA family transporter [Rhodoplanes sp.]NVO14666.1 EamA family transporter [Rhodoplanes sp.]
MTAGTEYALVAMVFFGLGDWIYRRAARDGVSAHHFLMGQAWLFCPSVVLYAAATGTLTLAGGAAWGNLAGLFLFLGLLLFARSLRSGPVSVNGPIFRLGFVVTVGLAVVVLGEPLTAAKAAGLMLALIAVWLLLGTTGGTASGAATFGRSPTSRRSLLEVLLATVLAGIGYFCHKLGTAAGAAPSTLVAAQAMVFASLATLLTATMERSLRWPPGLWRHAVPAAVVLIAAFLFFVHALGSGPASVVVPIAQMGFVPASVLGIVIGGEPLTVRKGLGLAVALAALALLAWG